jgi:hypothetical protein
MVIHTCNSSRRLRQEGHKYKSNLSYIVISTVSKNMILENLDVHMKINHYANSNSKQMKYLTLRPETKNSTRKHREKCP